MSFKTNLRAALAACVLATPLAAPVMAQEVTVKDAYARSASPSAKSGAAFMEIHNTSDQDDRLIAARSDVAARVELHTHKETGDGVMQMLEVEEGFAIPAGETHMLMRGGDHVMFMGLKTPFEQDKTIPVTLVFEKAGEVTVQVPVDLTRKPGAAAHKH